MIFLIGICFYFLASCTMSVMGMTVPKLLGNGFWELEDPKLGNGESYCGVPSTMKGNYCPSIPIEG